MLLDLYPTTRHDIDLGNFPLTHDCILKVDYINASPIRFQYFTCSAPDSAKISDVLLKLNLVRKVNIVSVDKLPDVW